MLSDSISFCKKVYTSSVNLKINRRCRIRVGPLPHITSDLTEHDCESVKPRQYRLAPMEHNMLEGTYCVQRVKECHHDSVGLHQVQSKIFTVITLQDLDPVMIVDDLRQGIAFGKRALAGDVVFNDRRWMELIGEHRSKTLMIPKTRQLEARDALRQRLALAAHVCHTKMGSIVTSSQMDANDIFTCYVRLMSKPFGHTMMPILSSPSMTEFAIVDQVSKAVTAIGVSLPMIQEGIHGCVLYTHSDLAGNRLPRKRAFAIVFGPPVLSYNNDNSLDIERPLCCGDYDKTELTCYEFVSEDELRMDAIIRDYMYDEVKRKKSSEDDDWERPSKSVRLEFTDDTSTPQSLLEQPSEADVVDQSHTSVINEDVASSDVISDEDSNQLPEDLIDIVIDANPFCYTDVMNPDELWKFLTVGNTLMDEDTDDLYEIKNLV